MYELTHQYCFVATHQIHGVPDAHPCANVHSHRWTLEVVLMMGVLLPTDGPSELAWLEPLRAYLTNELHGHHLNDIVIGPPTPARVARHIAIWGQQTLDNAMIRNLGSIVVAADANSRAKYTLPRAVR
jgi:6-pyruvoyltetrahydropterin/6-carboxytetrahydropterin synthase